MSNSNNQPLPCPCCGSEVSASTAFQNGSGTYYFIRCSCGLSLSGQFEADIVKRWNRRSPVSNPE